MQANRNSHTTSTKCQYQAAASKPKCCFGVKAPCQRAEQAHQQEDRADEHVRAVEARRHEERRAVDVAGVAERGVLYSYAWKTVKVTPRMTVRIRPRMRLRRSFLSSAWCAQVTVTPEISRISVLTSGRRQGSNVCWKMPGVGAPWPGSSRRCLDGHRRPVAAEQLVARHHADDVVGVLQLVHVAPATARRRSRPRTRRRRTSPPRR